MTYIVHRNEIEMLDDMYYDQKLRTLVNTSYDLFQKNGLDLVSIYLQCKIFSNYYCTYFFLCCFFNFIPVVNAKISFIMEYFCFIIPCAAFNIQKTTSVKKKLCHLYGDVTLDFLIILKTSSLIHLWIW
jgi:hypothetical protein